MRNTYVAVFLILCTPVLAHDHAKPDLDKWFDALQSNNGICCSGHDGKVVLAADWETKDGHYRVRIDNEWHDVHDDAVVKVPNLDGQTIVWPIKVNGSTFIRCFMPGVMS